MGREGAPAQPILDGARRAIDRYGWGKTTLERIAEEAGISRVTLHRRGLSKQVILGQLAAQAEAEYRERIWPALTSEGDGRARLQLALEAICDLAEENLNLLLALDGEANAHVFHEPSDGEELTRNVFTEPLERLLRDGAADGSLGPTDPIEMATVLFNSVGWTYIHLRSGHRWSPQRARASTLGLVLLGIAAR
ncbi:MAG: TetR/AcrR family transcriptional regulator [Solirubrobacterales bacterium]